jgi:hypothetical protein
MMAELFPISVQEMIREVEREIMLRRRVYPGWVAAKRLSQDKADKQIAIMEAVSRELQNATATAAHRSANLPNHSGTT